MPTAVYQYSDPGDVFEREPFAVRFHSNTTGRCNIYIQNCLWIVKLVFATIAYCESDYDTRAVRPAYRRPRTGSLEKQGSNCALSDRMFMFFHCALPQFTQLYEWVLGNRQWLVYGCCYRINYKVAWPSASL